MCVYIYIYIYIGCHRGAAFQPFFLGRDFPYHDLPGAEFLGFPLLGQFRPFNV